MSLQGEKKGGERKETTANKSAQKKIPFYNISKREAFQWLVWSEILMHYEYSGGYFFLIRNHRVRDIRHSARK